MNTLHRHANLLVSALLAACVLFTLLVLSQPRLLGIRVSLAGDSALFVFPLPFRTAGALAVALLLSAAALAAGRRLGPAASRDTGYGRLLRALAPLALAPLAVVPTILRGFVPDLVSANVLFFLPVALLAAVAVRGLPLLHGGAGRGRIGSSHILLAVVLGTVFYTLAGWYFSRMAGEHSGDEGHYLVQAQSLYQDHDLDLANNLKRDKFGNLQYERHHVSPRSRGGHAYSWHPFGLSLLLWPAMGAGLLARQFVLGAIAALGVGGMLALCARCRARAPGALLVTGLVACSALWGIYAFRALPEVLGATLLLWLTVATFWQKERPWAAVATAALCCAALPWAHTRFVPSSLLGAALFVLAGLAVPADRKRRLWVFSALCAAGYALYAAVMLSMFEGGQSYPIRTWLLEYPAGMWHMLTGKRGVLYSLPLFCWLLAAAVRDAAEDRKAGLPAVVALLQVAAIVVTSGGTTSWHGGACVAGRYLLIAVPLLVGPAARQFDRAGSPARWWLAFLGLSSCLTFFLILLRLPLIGMSFGYFDSALPEVIPPLIGWLQPLLRDYPPQWPFFAIALYVATALLLFVRSRRVLWQGALLAGVAAAAVAGHRQMHAEESPIETVRNARALANLDLSTSLIMPRPVPATRTPLLDAVDALAETAPASLAAQAPGPTVGDGAASDAERAVADWAGRGYRWMRLVPPLPSGRGCCLVRLRGRVEGEGGLWFAVRQDSRTLLERELPPGADGSIDVCQTLECGAGGEASLLVRLSVAQGAFIAESASWAPCAPQLLAAGGLDLPQTCR